MTTLHSTTIYRWVVRLGAALIAAAPASGQRSPRHPVPVAAPAARADAAVKGVWEPVSYGEDLELASVFFVTPQLGWVSGAAGTILKTTDGGAHWTPQLGGDPGGNANTIRDLRFLDATHGFAAQPANGDNALLQTQDGEHWQAHGTVPQHRGDYLFVTPTVGFASTRNQIIRTTDGGLTWTPVLDCGLKLNVGGVTRAVSCTIETMHFPSARVGYALGGSPEVPGVFQAKTEDGGTTWTVSLPLPDDHGPALRALFTDENNGAACLWGGKVARTTDGGRSWTGSAGVTCSGTRGVHFADPEVGWMLGTREWLYTTDGGALWNSRKVTFPAEINGFSMPRRDVGYAVGDHGLVFRFRVVPVDYKAPNAIDAPAMPGVLTAVEGKVDRAESQLQALGTAINAAPETSGASAPAGAFVDQCCAAASTPIAASISAVATDVPALLGRYRNVNLVMAGLRLVGTLSSQLSTVQQAYDSVRHAPDKIAALGAVANLSSALQGLDGGVKTALLDQPPTLGDAAVTADAGTVQPALPAGASMTDTAGAPMAAPPAAQPPTPAAAEATAVDAKAAEAKKKKDHPINIHVKLPKF